MNFETTQKVRNVLLLFDIKKCNFRIASYNCKCLRNKMINIGKERLGIQEFRTIIEEKEQIRIDPSAQKRVSNSFKFLSQFIKGRVIYGINTGFGPMAQYRIEDSKRIELQENLIRSHCSGMGEVLRDDEIKAAIICRLNSLLLGYSGVHPDTTALLANIINHDIYPVIYEHGGVGASGDLVQLAHLALALLGESKVKYNGKHLEAMPLYKKLGIAPLNIRIREGIALMNGTSVMTGIGLINILKAQHLLNWSVMISSIITELVQSFNDSFSPILNNTKEHPGQQFIAQTMSHILQDSQLIDSREDVMYSNSTQHNVFKKRVQEFYSIRCIPQVLGPIHDCIEYAEKVLVSELNSANDNPIICAQSLNVYHGGNFHGDYISLEMDKLRLAITKLSMIHERQINFLMNSKLNAMLPPFVNLGQLGLNFGLQGAQFTATSNTAENQSLASSIYIHSIPNNNDNQDIVSMGTNAAVLTRKVLENTYEILSIEMVALLQAVDYLQVQNKLSSRTRSVYERTREIVPIIIQDRPLYDTLTRLKLWLMDNEPNA